MAYVVAANHDRCDGHTCLLTNLDRVQSHDKGWLSLPKMLPVANALKISHHRTGKGNHGSILARATP
jgi:NADH:ubiquinone oxidoreductase subunit E